MEHPYGDPPAVWEPWVDDLRGTPIDSGHHPAEEEPAARADALRDRLLLEMPG